MSETKKCSFLVFISNHTLKDKYIYIHTYVNLLEKWFKKYRLGRISQVAIWISQIISSWRSESSNISFSLNPIPWLEIPIISSIISHTIYSIYLLHYLDQYCYPTSSVYTKVIWAVHFYNNCNKAITLECKIYMTGASTNHLWKKT